MVEAHEVEERGMKVVDMNRIFFRLEAKIVGVPVGDSALYAATGQKNGEAVVVVVAAGLDFDHTAHFHCQGSAEFAADENQGFLQ